jgi:mannose-6-phosphate isomerase
LLLKYKSFQHNNRCKLNEITIYGGSSKQLVFKYQKIRRLVSMLYPLKFVPQLKPRIWGGNRIKNLTGKALDKSDIPIGESWEISGIEGSVSVVSNGFLAGNTIEELIEIYMGDLVGEQIFQQFGVEFPLLVKFIDTADYLSIQVHPDDEMAKRLHHAYGKSEMWYIISGEPESKIITGFNHKLTRDKYLEVMKSGNLAPYLKYEPAYADDFFYIPSRRVHALGKGLLLIEIQQTSDITYRIYDWDRVDDKGIGRELHTDLASQAIDFDAEPVKREHKTEERNISQEIVSTPFFTVNRLILDKSTERSFIQLDTFRIYLCIEGEAKFECDGEIEAVHIGAGEVILIPACIAHVNILPIGHIKLLETYIELIF